MPSELPKIPKMESSNVFLERYKGVIGRNLFYELIAQRKLPHVRIGRKILVPSDAFERMMEQSDAGNGPENGHD